MIRISLLCYLRSDIFFYLIRIISAIRITTYDKISRIKRTEWKQLMYYGRNICFVKIKREFSLECYSIVDLLFTLTFASFYFREKFFN